MLSSYFILNAQPLHASTSEFDVSELESLFSAVVPKKNDSSGGNSGGRRKSVGSKSDIVHLVTHLTNTVAVEFLRSLITPLSIAGNASCNISFLDMAVCVCETNVLHMPN